jgi:hypothetical protein
MDTANVPNVKPDPADRVGFIFFGVWAAFGLFSWLWIRSRPSAAEKRVWHRRITIAAGIIFGAFVTAMIASWKNYTGLLIVYPAIFLITYLNLKNAFFCDSCGKFTQRAEWWSREPTFFCPKCGHKVQ